MINGSRSEWKDILIGIPQGSVLGLVLLVIYIYNFNAKHSQIEKLYLFADDSKLFREITSDKDVELLQEK